MTQPSSTEALIARLAAEPLPSTRFSPARMIATMAGTALLGLALQMALSGPRPDLAASLDLNAASWLMPSSSIFCSACKTRSG